MPDELKNEFDKLDFEALDYYEEPEEQAEPEDGDPGKPCQWTLDNREDWPRWYEEDHRKLVMSLRDAYYGSPNYRLEEKPRTLAGVLDKFSDKIPSQEWAIDVIFYRTEITTEWDTI